MRRGALGLTTAVLSSLLLGVLPSASPASADTVTYPMPATGKVTINGHGWGHGHGMSQYGAQGAATGNWGSRGHTPLTWQQILAFYYPQTVQATYAKVIRVRISADTTPDVVVAARPRLAVAVNATNEIRAVPVNGATRWRIVVASGNQTGVDYLLDGTWKRWWTFAGDGAFGAAGQPIRLYYGSTSRQYRGRLSAVRPTATSTDRDTINIVHIESYLRGVVPSEMPASWHINAVKAQAVAARTYAAYELQHPAGTYYDICDTTACQVYGGYDAEQVNSNTAIDGTLGVILTYGGTPAFTQFSSSSGGWTSAGSVPYLTAKADPYDDVRYPDGTAANANHDWTATPYVGQIEKAFGFGNLTSITVTRNDGHHVSTLTLTGTANGQAKTVKTYGDTFRSKLGLKSTYFAFAPPPPPPAP